MTASLDNISNLIAQPVEEYTPEPRHVSKYRDSIIRALKRGKSAHKTLGVPSVKLDPPNEFLKKKSGSISIKPTIHHEHYRRPDYQRKLPEWQPVRASDQEKRELQSSKDFKKQNMEDVKNLRPSKARMYYVDDRHGTAQPLKTSGMYPHYINKMDYGVPPGRVSQAMERRKMRNSSPKRNTRGESKSKRDEQFKEKKRRETVSPRRWKDSLIHKEGDGIKLNDQKGKSKEQREKSKERKERSRRRTSPRRTVETGISKRKIEGTVDEEADVNGESKEDDENEISRGEENSQSEEDSRESQQSTGEDVSRTGSKFDEEEREKDGRSKRASLKTAKSKPASEAGTAGYRQPRCRYVSEDERAELLYGMKKKWDQMMKEFQGLPFLTDTQPKMRRKNQMEKDLLHLEKDIDTIERHPYIYVYSDSDE